MNVLEPQARLIIGASAQVRLTALSGVPLVRRGDDLISIILAALAASGETLCDGDVLVLAQKIVSKAQGRLVDLNTVVPSAEAERLAREVNKSARLVELILRESTEVVRHRRDVLVVAHRLGLVMANAGIDQSNVEQGGQDDTALLLPEDPDDTCAKLRAALRSHTGAEVAVIINDSHGRAFRNGTVGVAIGASGLPALADLRGAPDLYGRRLQSTEVGLADEIASAASLLMGQASEGHPIVLVRGLNRGPGEGCAADLVRPKKTDLFRAPPGPDVGDVLRQRRSVRRYTSAPVPDDLVLQVLDAAIHAPSAHNRQPWRFAVLKTRASKERLAHAMGERLREDRARDRDAADAIEQDVARSIARITGAPVAIAVSLTMQDMDAYPDARRAAAEHLMAVQGTAMAMQNLLVAAEVAGLSASLMCAPLFCPDVVRAALTLPSLWEPQALITLGFAANAGKPFRRRALADVVRMVDC
ncbi:MAG TPA: coenzyme F420-0:L-glutamate ligase [Xanthobacteraceae bacterium]|jgi:coenzyme F420-0:L-glutamate ligase/coenzyme F420-1:gamma-L-glutamate ligase